VRAAPRFLDTDGSGGATEGIEDTMSSFIVVTAAAAAAAEYD